MIVEQWRREEGGGRGKCTYDVVNLEEVMGKSGDLLQVL